MRELSLGSRVGGIRMFTPLKAQYTDRNGKIAPVAIAVPELSASQTPDTGIIPYATVNIYARLKDYIQIESETTQVFANTVTTQNLEMIPLSELPDQWSEKEIFRTPPQNL